MILVDTSVWIDHLRAGEPALVRLLDDGDVLGHPSVTGELAMGHLQPREELLVLLGQLPQATVATDREVLALVERKNLMGLGIGYVDAQLLAATLLTDGARLWTRDRRLSATAERLGVGSG